MRRTPSFARLVAASAVLFVAAPAAAQPAAASPATAARTTLTVDVTYAGLQQWARTRQALERLGGGASASVQAIAIDGAIVTLTWTGPRDALVRALRAAGLTLTEAAGRPVVRLAGT